MYASFIRKNEINYLRKLRPHPVSFQLYETFKELSFTGSFRELSPNLQKAILKANPLVVLRMKDKTRHGSNEDVEEFFIGGFQYLEFLDEESILNGKGYKFSAVWVITQELDDEEILQVTLGSVFNLIPLQLDRDKDLGQLLLTLNEGLTKTQKAKYFERRSLSAAKLGKWLGVSGQTIQRQVNKIKGGGDQK